MSGQPRNTFGTNLRLHGDKAYAAVFENKLRKSAGPLAVCARPNGLAHLRLGLSVGRRVGNAVRRHRVKRLIREAFRIGRHDWPTGFDIVVIIHPHAPLPLAEYQRLLGDAITSVEREQRRRSERAESGG